MCVCVFVVSSVCVHVCSSAGMGIWSQGASSAHRCYALRGGPSVPCPLGACLVTALTALPCLHGACIWCLHMVPAYGDCTHCASLPAWCLHMVPAYGAYAWCLRCRGGPHLQSACMRRCQAHMRWLGPGLQQAYASGPEHHKDQFKALFNVVPLLLFSTPLTCAHIHTSTSTFLPHPPLTPPLPRLCPPFFHTSSS